MHTHIGADVSSELGLLGVAHCAGGGVGICKCNASSDPEAETNHSTSKGLRQHPSYMSELTTSRPISKYGKPLPLEKPCPNPPSWANNQRSRNTTSPRAGLADALHCLKAHETFNLELRRIAYIIPLIVTGTRKDGSG